MRPGQILSAKVLQIKADGRVLITSGTKSFEAHAAFSLREGEKYEFLVRSSGPRIELKVLERVDPFKDSALKAWDSGREMRRTFSTILRDLSKGGWAAHLGKASSQAQEQIRRLLPLLLYEGSTRDEAVMLPQRLLSSGIFWENKVLRHLLTAEKDKTLENLRADDLKGLLLRLKEDLQAAGEPSRELRANMEQVDRLLSIIQNHQALNLSAMGEGWGWYWFIPAGDEREFRYGEIFGKQSADGENHHIQMNLSFTRLGEIWVSGLLRDIDVSVDIRATSDRVASFLETNLPLLEEGLKRKGLKIGRLACEMMPEGNSFNPFSEGVDSISAIDVVI